MNLCSCIWPLIAAACGLLVATLIFGALAFLAVRWARVRFKQWSEDQEQRKIARELRVAAALASAKAKSHILGTTFEAPAPVFRECGVRSQLVLYALFVLLVVGIGGSLLYAYDAFG